MALAVGLSFRLIPIGWCSFKAFVQVTFLSFLVQFRKTSKATFCPSGVINSVKKLDILQLFWGAKEGFFSLVACAVSPKLGGSANLAS